MHGFALHTPNPTRWFQSNYLYIHASTWRIRKIFMSWNSSRVFKNRLFLLIKIMTRFLKINFLSSYSSVTSILLSLRSSSLLSCSLPRYNASCTIRALRTAIRSSPSSMLFLMSVRRCTYGLSVGHVGAPTAPGNTEETVLIP